MRIKCLFALVISIIMLKSHTILAGEAASKPSGSIESVCNEFGTKIKSMSDNGKYLEAIGAAAEYEQMLLMRYPASTFELGLFQSESHHLSFHSPFENWTQESLKELEIPEWLPAMGFDYLIALKGKAEEDRFILLSMDLGKVMYRITGEKSSRGKLSDQELQLCSQMVAANFGVAKSEEFKEVGDHRVHVIEIGTPALGPSLICANLAEKGRCYFFLLGSAAGKRAENEKKLYELIKTVDFKYKPEDSARIASARGKVTDKANIGMILECIKELATAGEYGAAAEELTDLRLNAAEKMPKPEIVGNTGRYTPYGITLTNPNPEKWKLTTESQGGMAMIILEDRFSVSPSGVMVAVINTILAYGPHANELMGKGSEEEKKSVLANAGQGGMRGMGGEIESERFLIFKGDFAYEGVASVPMQNTKAKAIVALKPGHMVMVIMLIPATNFNERAAEFDSIVDKHLQMQNTGEVK